MDIRRHQRVGNKSVEQMVKHCLDRLEEDGFAEDVDWDTEIAPSLTLEEMVGALVRAEAEFIDGQEEELRY